MSDLQRIHDSLHKVFHVEDQRIVFWHDPEQEFLIAMESLTLNGVTTVRLDQESSLKVKILLEQKDTAGKYLLYSPSEEPDYEADWLLDIRLYSRSFRADRSSIMLQDLGLKQQSLRTHLAEKRRFFDAKDRFAKLKSLIQPEDNASDIDRKMMAVLVKADPELFSLVRSVFHGFLDMDAVDLNAEPEGWLLVEKFELDTSFWEMTKAAFAYESDKPTLKNLLIRLLVTEFAQKLKGDCPQGIRGLVLPERGRDNAVVCIGQWKDSGTKGASYERLSTEVAAIIQLETHLTLLELESLADVFTFVRVEQEVAKRLRNRIRETVETIQIDPIRLLVSQRQVGYWVTASLADTAHAQRSSLFAVYDALLSVAEFHALWNQHKQNLNYSSAQDVYRAYEGELYQLDQHYRHFMEAADIAEARGWDITKALRPELEAHYTNGFLGSLALAWGQFLSPAGGFLNQWNLGQVPNQYRFFERTVAPWLGDSENRRAFVIVSDAFRYEAAQELASLLNGKYRMEATLSSQLGVVPSFTALGMAALLPHSELSFKGSDVLVDGSPSGAGDRDAILQKIGGMACKADALMALKKDEGRELVRDKRVIYIYHDTVDAIGDDAKTETKTFEAVRSAIKQLDDVVTYLVNNLNAGFIVVTADHGFLYTDSQPTETDKSTIETKPANALIAKKRYILGPNLPQLDNAWHGTVKNTASVVGEMEFLIPRGTSRFHFIGGARFVHGGAMPQEICVPVLTIKHVRGRETRVRPVGVLVLGNQHRITTGVCRFQLLQTEATGDRLKAVTLSVGIYGGDLALSEIKVIKFDCATDSMEDRKKWVVLTLTGRSFDKKKLYHLVLSDQESGIEQQRVEVIIDRAVSDDF